MAKKKTKSKILFLILIILLSLSLVALWTNSLTAKQTALFSEPESKILTITKSPFTLENPDKIFKMQLTLEGCMPVDKDDQPLCELPFVYINNLQLGSFSIPKCSSDSNLKSFEETPISGFFKEINELNFEGACEGYDLITGFKLILKERLECLKDTDCYNPILLKTGRCEENECNYNIPEIEKQNIKAQVAYAKRNLYWISSVILILITGLILFLKLKKRGKK